MNVVKGASTAAVWLGLRYSRILGIWYWVSGETVCYRNWAPGNGTSEEDCEHAVRSGAVQSGGDQRWISHKLILIKENLTWSEALRYCRQNNMDLVSVHSEEIQRRVMNVVKGASAAAVWLGLRYSHILGIWYWVSGETVCYHNWAPGNGTSEEDCEHAVRSGAVQSGGDQRWISRPETDKLNFICSRY
ncbi:hypothetical protein Q8A67_012394 [Cirrhinus molitorella]|uniref:C-type lectin domain-containing protein n=1 Tax=Cirrhinus molitorella TaxID=172907 RepID=A0AA88PT64_9TELE|nr:hypothetical protein Q8A67_012394 [Cirrhinus molitorella]